MRRLIICLFSLFCIKGNSQTTFIGDQAHGFKQLLLQSIQSTFSDSSQPEMGCAAWTCNSLGFPTCNTRTLFKYNISTIPTSAVVTNAKLYLYAKPTNLNGQTGNPMFGTANISYLQKVVTNWAPISTGWSTQPSVTTTAQKTLPQSASTVQNYVIDVTDFVQSWVNRPDSNFGVILRLQNETYYNSMIFYSGTASSESLKPKLEVTYNTTLPLSFTNFVVSSNSQTNLLQWTLSSKQDVMRIEVERSENSKDFNKVGSVDASSNASLYNYQFNDLTANRMKLYYRLKLVQKDGGILYSKTITIGSTGNASNLQIFPNPVRKDFQISLNATNDVQSTIYIQNSVGQVVQNQTVGLRKGSNSIAVQLNNTLSPGLYIVSIVMGDKKLQEKLIVQ